VVPSLPPPAAVLPAERLLLELGEALHRFGTPSYRLEQALTAVAARLGIEAQVFCVPTSLVIAFGPLGAQRTGLLRLDAGAADLGKLARLDAVLRRILDGHADLDAAIADVRAIVAAPAPLPGAVVLLAAAGSSAAAARFFGGDLPDIAAAAAIGLVVGVVDRLSERTSAPHLAVPAAAAIGAALATAAPLLLGRLRVELVTIAGLLALLPGLTFTTGMTELATRNFVAGTARVTMAILTLLELAFGTALGHHLVRRVVDGLPRPLSKPAALPDAVDMGFVALAGLCLAVIFRARLVDVPVAVAAAFVGFAGSRLGGLGLGPDLGPFLAALLVAVFANGVARLTRRPAQVALLPGILVLVPGSLGLRSVTGMLEDETLRAIDGAFQMGMVAVSLSMGVLVANVVVRPRRML
jgi:uncharacterized membrane protein YjjP (DUF1212 family)